MALGRWVSNNKNVTREATRQPSSNLNSKKSTFPSSKALGIVFMVSFFLACLLCLLLRFLKTSFNHMDTFLAFFIVSQVSRKKEGTKENKTHTTSSEERIMREAEGEKKRIRKNRFRRSRREELRKNKKKNHKKNKFYDKTYSHNSTKKLRRRRIKKVLSRSNYRFENVFLFMLLFATILEHDGGISKK